MNSLFDELEQYLASFAASTMLKHVAQVEIAYSATAGVSGKQTHYVPELSRIRDFIPTIANRFFGDCDQSIDHILIREPATAPHWYRLEVSEVESHPAKLRLPFLGHRAIWLAKIVMAKAPEFDIREAAMNKAENRAGELGVQPTREEEEQIRTSGSSFAYMVFYPRKDAESRSRQFFMSSIGLSYCSGRPLRPFETRGGTRQCRYDERQSSDGSCGRLTILSKKHEKTRYPQLMRRAGKASREFDLALRMRTPYALGLRG